MSKEVEIVNSVRWQYEIDTKNQDTPKIFESFRYHNRKVSKNVG